MEGDICTSLVKTLETAVHSAKVVQAFVDASNRVKIIEDKIINSTNLMQTENHMGIHKQLIFFNILVIYMNSRNLYPY